MSVDRKLLREALRELVRLKSSVGNPARVRALLYSSALAEWAGRLGVDQIKLDRLVLVRGVAAGRRFS